MIRYALRRLAKAIPMVLLLSIGTFVLLDLSPGDAATAILSRNASGVRANDVANLREQLGLDEPLPARYVDWFTGAVRGDLGNSYQSGRPVRDILADAIPPTLFLLTVALSMTALLAIALGVTAGVRPRSVASRLINGFVVLTYSSPGFLVAILLILVFSVQLGWLPATGLSAPGEAVTIGQLASHVALPALAICVSHHLGSLIRIVESSVAETSDAPYVDAARSRGISKWRVVAGYRARAAMVPYVAQLGTMIGAFVASSYVIEAIFSWPGLGRVMIDAANARDYPVLISVILFSAIAVILANVVADVLVAVLDPRVRLGNERPSGAPEAGADAGSDRSELPLVPANVA